MSTEPPLTDGDDLAIWDTPLHRPIEPASVELSTGALVIYYPTTDTPEAFIQTDCYLNTYDAR